MLDLHQRSGTDADAEFIFRCIKAALGPSIVATYGAWDEEGQREHFARTTYPRKHKILELSGIPVGCVLVEEHQAHIDLHRILLLPEFQNRGIGTRVVQEILAKARPTGRPIRLQVFRVNPARRLYERLGFSVVGETKTHYLVVAGD